MRALPSLVCIFVLAVTSAADASDRIDRAEEALGDARFEEALRLLNAEAKRVQNDDEAAAMIQLRRGQALHGMNKLKAARAALRRALTLEPDPEVDPDRSSPTFLAFLEEVRSTVLGELTVTSNRPDAHVSIDGKPMGPVPLRTRFPVGRRHIELKAGEVRDERMVVVDASKAVHVDIALQADVPRAAQVPSPTPSLAQPYRTNDAPEVKTQATATAHIHASKGEGGQWLRWVPGAAGLAMVGAGAYFLVQAKEDLDSLDTAPALTLAEADAHRTRGKRNRTMGIAGLAVGTAGVATSVLLLMLSSPESQTTISVAPTTTGLHLGVGGAWK